MPDRFSLVRWRDAKTDPPPTRFDELEPVLMEVDGEVIPGWWNNRDWFDWECSGDSPDMPDRWAYMPSPPGDDPLTVEDMRRVLRLASVTAADAPSAQTAVTRLHRALDALPKEDDDAR